MDKYPENLLRGPCKVCGEKWEEEDPGNVTCISCYEKMNDAVADLLEILDMAMKARKFDVICYAPRWDTEKLEEAYDLYHRLMSGGQPN